IQISHALKKQAELSPAKQALLERMRQHTSPAVPMALRPRPAGASAPLSFAQQRMWLLQQLDPESYQYKVPRALHIRGPLEISSLAAALNAIIARHEILRTTFPADENGQPWQSVAAELKVDLAVVELGSLAEEERLGEAQERTLTFAFEAFDL